MQSTYYYSGYRLGASIMDGMYWGIEDGKYRVASLLADLARQLKNKAEDELEINSPSKVFMRIGQSIDEGLALGVTKDFGYVGDSVVNVAHSTIDAMREAIKGANAEIDGSLQLSPIITPKLDLSLVKNHAGSINRLFDARVEANAELVAANQNGESNTTGGTTFIQNNYSPKALNREEIYRQTRNQFAMTRKAVGTNDTVSYGY